MLNGKELQVGKSYKDSMGRVFIISESGYIDYPYFGKLVDGSLCSFTKEGYSNETTRNEYDLIIEDINDVFNTVTKPKHYQLIPEKNIEVKHIVAVLADRLGTNGYNGAFIGDYVQLLQYLMRFDEKNGKEDLEKAKEFLSGMIEKYPCVQLKGQK